MTNIYYEHNVTERKYINVALINTIKEFRLRVKSTKFRLWLFLAIIVAFFSTTFALIIIAILLCVHLIHLINEIFRYRKTYLIRSKHYPQGLKTRYTDEWFQSSTMFDQKWERISWNRITLLYDNIKTENISLYDGQTGSYHLFFLRKTIN